jgi:signal transduction histidine kinase
LTSQENPLSVLILAPRGRDAAVASTILKEAGIPCLICPDLHYLLQQLMAGADIAIITEEAIRNGDGRNLSAWAMSQPPWSDFPFILLTEHGGGVERNPAAARLTERLGNVSFLERPFHPTTLVSIVQSALRGRQRQYECRRLNEELELRVHERTSELAAANRQLVTQIDERERVESTLRQMQRLEAVGQLTSGVAHDFNNLLTVILGNVSLMEKGLGAAEIDDPRLLQKLQHMRMAAQRGAKLTDQLLTFSRRQRLEPKSVNVNDTLTAMRDLLTSTMGGSIQIESQFDTEVSPALVDPTQLELAVLNLAINARDAMESHGRLTISTRNDVLGQPTRPEEPAAGRYVVVCVTDTGSGMSDEVRAKAFEPFFTTKGVGKGSGLGLSQVMGFAKQTGGGIRLETEAGHGTAIHIYLPQTASPAIAPSAHSVSTGMAPSPDTTILLVDDDSAVREVTAATLQDFGYAVIEAGSGGAALDLLDRNQQIALVVLDFAMPGMNGAELARHMKQRRPGLPLLFVTGYADRAALSGFADEQIIGKPFMDDELVQKVGSALSAPRH